MKHRLKFLFLLLLLLGSSPAVMAQYGFGTNAPDSSAVWDVVSTTKGFLLPRMTQSELDALAAKSPTEGLLVYNTTRHCLAYYSPSSFDCVSVPVLPVATNVTYGSSMKVGATLTASYVYNHAQGTPEASPLFKWYYKSTINGASTDLNVSTKTYVITRSAGEYIAVGVTPVASDGKKGVEVVSDYKQVLAADAVATPYVSSISYTASVPTICSKLTVSTQCDDEDSPVSALINWYYCTDAAGTGRSASVGTGDSYALTTADKGKYLIAGVTPQSTVAPLTGTEVFASNAIGPITSEFTVNHVAGDGVAPVNAVITYGITLTTFNQKCWITRNLGASQQATKADDDTAASAGWYFQFNRAKGWYNPGVNDTMTASWSTTPIDENNGWKPENDPCASLGSGWRLPTSSEWGSVKSNYGWSSYNSSFASDLKLHAAGFLAVTGLLTHRGINGAYYSSDTYSSGTEGYFLYLDGSGLDVLHNYSKVGGLSVRCLKSY